MIVRKIVVGICLAVMLFEPVFAVAPVMSFMNKNAINFKKVLNVGEIELLEFAQPVSLAHYGSSEQSLNYIELEKLNPSKTGYKNFMIKAKSPGNGVLTFQAGEEVIKVKVVVKENYSHLEAQLNDLFGMKNDPNAIQVVSANLVSDLDIDNGPRVFLKGKVPDSKSAMLAVAFAANALGDKGVKIFSNPGGQLRAKELDISKSNQGGTNINLNSQQQQSFAEYYESTNKLIDTNNLNRDLVLASEEERVISFLKIAEPKRYAVKVRFLEMDTRLIDEFVSSVNFSSTSKDIFGVAGTNTIPVPGINQASGLGVGRSTSFITDSAIAAVSQTVGSGNLVSGSVKLLENTLLNVDINDLLNEGALRVVNEFSLIAHSGEAVSLGKGTRYPIPQLNNTLANNSLTVEYIPIGFKGELKITGLENELIDVQMATRLSSAEATSTSLGGINVPIFNEEYVNSGAMLKDGQELILNAFLTETEAVAKSTSPLGRLIPFLGSSKRRRKRKNLLFIAVEAQEVLPSSMQVTGASYEIPHVDINNKRNIFAHHVKKLEKNNAANELDLATMNNSRIKEKYLEAPKVDALELDGDL